ncbi:MAG TPA: hypothetical protein VFC44_09895 [Candidatus Saccharimonadales bacterium]|nr:hypothetical protein [Candidatus Saccharimonadales bacterium]
MKILFDQGNLGPISNAVNALKPGDFIELKFQEDITRFRQAGAWQRPTLEAGANGLAPDANACDISSTVGEVAEWFNAHAWKM